MQRTVVESLNPFVSQVNFYLCEHDVREAGGELSQSLRKSGQFLSLPPEQQQAA